MADDEEGWRRQEPGEEHSWGRVSDRHWSKKRRGKNREAIEHMRGRSRAPGVEGGGGARNHYCMECDGVIPFEGSEKVVACPHCGAALDERVQAMFNWVEIDDAPTGDFGALVRVASIGLAVLVTAALVAWWMLR